MKIKTKDISVIVQGAIDSELTPKCLKSIRKHLRGAQIILSTWEGSKVDGLDYDILVENKDPGGALMCKKTKLYNNVNRQLVSTQNGLEKAERKYAIKFRTDFYLMGNDFLKYFDKFPSRDENFACFKERVIICSALSRLTSEIGVPTPFHLSDFFLFGLTEDIKLYFEKTTLMPDGDLANYSYLYPDKKPYKNDSLNFRYAPEQYLGVSFAKRHLKNLKFEDWTDWNDENIELSKKFLMSNFIFLGFPESGAFSDKHWQSLLYETKFCPGLITYKIFKNMYKEMLDSNFDVSLSRWEKFKRFKRLFCAAIIKSKDSLYYSLF